MPYIALAFNLMPIGIPLSKQNLSLSTPKLQL